MDNANNDFVDMLGEHTRERATERDSGCASRELLWVDIFLRTNSIIQANQTAGYAGSDRRSHRQSSESASRGSQS